MDIRLEWPWAFRFELIRHDGIVKERAKGDPFNRTLVPVAESAVFCADPTVVLRRVHGTWATCAPRH